MSRLEFRKSTKQEALRRSEGRCEASGPYYNREWDDKCGADLALGVQFDHFILASEGGDNSLDNCRAVCPSCHSWKTRKIDTPKAAKIKRIARKNGPIELRRKTKPLPSRQWPKRQIRREI